MHTPSSNKPVKPISVCRASYIPFKSRRKPHPVLSLSGQWLQEAGFYIGCVVNIVGTPGRLTITIAGTQNYAELQQLLQRENIEFVKGMLNL